jgi:hypothetical protein
MTYDLNYCTKCGKSPCKCDTESELRGRVKELLDAVSHVRVAGELEGQAGQYLALLSLFALHDKITTTLEGK